VSDEEGHWLLSLVSIVGGAMKPEGSISYALTVEVDRMWSKVAGMTSRDGRQVTFPSFRPLAWPSNTDYVVSEGFKSDQYDRLTVFLPSAKIAQTILKLTFSVSGRCH